MDRTFTRRSGVVSAVLLILLILTAQLTRARTQQTSTAVPTTFINPILPHGADPWVIWHDGFYYLTCTTGRTLTIRKSSTLQRMASGKEVTVWRAPAHGPDSDQVWAPELHWIHHRWYLYFAADDGPDAHHRIFVLESLGADAQGAYQFRGKIADPSDRWAIDPTVLNGRHGRLYLVWSGWPGEHGPQEIYIAPMSNPWTISGARVELSQPTYSWEIHGWRVNEGPEMLEHRGKLFLIYSASGGSTRYYCLGMLEHTHGDVLDPNTWKKSPVPVFEEYDGPDGAVYGPGHCSFTRSPDGREDWIVYHARDFPQNSWANRSTRTQPFTWRADGTPDFGHPIPDGVPLPCPR